jgi:3-deoxy-D-manno-octulosonic-acid transferase
VSSGLVAPAVARAAYRTAGRVLAAGCAAAAALPAAPAGWRAAADRLGRLDATAQAMAASAPAVWVHAASVGELNAVRPLVAELRERMPGRVIVVSTLTRTGLEVARTMPEAHLATLFPLDAPRPVAAVAARFRLEAFLFTETEVWPVWLEAMRAAGVPSIMVSGRVSERSAARARWLRPLYGPALADVTCCMQTDEDARRIVALGADPRRVQVAGSLKFEATAVAPAREVERFAAAVGAPQQPLVVAGSTHDGEEALVLDVYRRLSLAHRDVALLLAPRHLERLDAVEAAVRERRLPVVRFGALAEQGAAAPSERPLVVLLDRMGVLAQCYRLAAVAFVGGSLVPIGGHNVVEPAQAGVPVLVGPHTQNAPDVVDRLITAGGALRVTSEDTLALALDHLLATPAAATAMGQRARAAAQSGQGALERHLKIVTARLSTARFARHGPVE